MLQRFGDANIAVIDVGLRRPTLDDVFLTLIGHVAEEVGPAAGGSSPADDDREKEVV